MKNQNLTFLRTKTSWKCPPSPQLGIITLWEELQGKTWNNTPQKGLYLWLNPYFSPPLQKKKSFISDIPNNSFYGVYMSKLYFTFKFHTTKWLKNIIICPLFKYPCNAKNSESLFQNLPLYKHWKFSVFVLLAPLFRAFVFVLPLYFLFFPFLQWKLVFK